MSRRLRTWTPYLLPNILTSLNLLAGFYAIIQAVNLNFSKAVWAILLAGIMDGLDGMAARLAHATSAFGIEFDSLADLVSFGLAPSIFMYVWVLKPYGRIGWVAVFLFMACGALRLARFNVQSHDVQKTRFLGIPIPMAAVQVITTYLIVDHLSLKSQTVGILVIITAYLTAFMMVSNIPYRSLKSISVKKKHSFYIPVLFILITAIIWIYPHVILWILSTLYNISGPAEALGKKIFSWKRTTALSKNYSLAAMKEKHRGKNHE